MAHKVFARKWRPATLSEVVGQNDIVSVLSQSLKNDRVGQAYLLTGTRGVGKTTLGRIIAKVLQCNEFPTDKACNECPSCKAHQSLSHPDLFEIDAASKTKVEDTRQLLEHAHYAPNLSRKKVYLIDEVHMLSTHSFNALLKTLEEPPEHIIFILATTELQKLPSTIVSRCQHLGLQALDQNTIKQMLSKILNHEQYKYDDNALDLLAESARGSMRDALTLLEQLCQRFPDGLNVQNLSKWLGHAPETLLEQLIDTIDSSDQARLVSLIELLKKQTIQPMSLMQQLLKQWHQSALNVIVDGKSDSRKYIDLFDTTVYGIRQLECVSDPWIVVEMTLLRSLSSPKQSTLVQNDDTSAKVTNTSDIYQKLKTIQTSGMLRHALNLLTFKSNDISHAFYPSTASDIFTDALCKKIKKLIAEQLQLDIIKFSSLKSNDKDNSLSHAKKIEVENKRTKAIEKLSSNTDVSNLMKSLDSALAESEITEIKS